MLNHFDEYANSNLEGINCGIKRCLSAVNFSMGLQKFIVVLSKTAERKRKESDRLCVQYD